MPSQRSSFLVVLVLASALLALPSRPAAPRPAAAEAGLITGARVWVSELFGKLPPAKPQPPRKAGCGIDPNGCR